MMYQPNKQESDVKAFIREIRQYATIEELDEAVLNRLMIQIMAGKVKKIDRQKYQEVKIIYNFVDEIMSI